MKINKTDILWFVILLLLVLNLSTIGTIIYQNHTNGDQREQIVIEPNCDPLNGQCFRQNLQFDATQMKEYRDINRHFRQQAQAIIKRIEEHKVDFFDELSHTETSKKNIHQLSEKIGHEHEALKVATANYYLKLKKICNAEQREQLKELFTPLFCNPNGNGCCRRHRAGENNRCKNNIY